MGKNLLGPHIVRKRGDKFCEIPWESVRVRYHGRALRFEMNQLQVCSVEQLEAIQAKRKALADRRRKLQTERDFQDAVDF